MAELTPMMKQYLELKQEYPDCILMFRLGDFYEMFFEDAELAARVLEIALTGRNCGLEERAPMCGVPHHSVDNYINRLIENGYKVAICDQLEDPSIAKGIVTVSYTHLIPHKSGKAFWRARIYTDCSAAARLDTRCKPV